MPTPQKVHQPPLGPSTDVTVTLTVRGKPKTFEAWYTMSSIGEIETTARRHLGMMVTIFDLITRPSPTNLALLLIDAINHEGDTGWGGERFKPSVKKMLPMLDAVGKGGEFLRVWRDVAAAIDANLHEPTNTTPPGGKDESDDDDDDDQGQGAPMTTTAQPDNDEQND